jgi:hypothetical protein
MESAAAELHIRQTDKALQVHLSFRQQPSSATHTMSDIYLVKSILTITVSLGTVTGAVLNVQNYKHDFAIANV